MDCFITLKWVRVYPNYNQRYNNTHEHKVCVHKGNTLHVLEVDQKRLLAMLTYDNITP